jgi:N-methylhydantoinase A
VKRIAIDIGGTFTDCFVAWDERQVEGKALTTHHNLANGFLEAIGAAAHELGRSPEEMLVEAESIRYGTTLGTNALIERKGPRIGVLVTMGFECMIGLSRGRGYGEGLPRHLQVDLPRATRPKPLVTPNLIVGIPERVDAVGEVLLPLDEQAVRVAVRKLVDRGAEVFVVSLFNSPVNPIHEERIEDIIRDEYPSTLFGSFPVILSSRISRRKSEYARTMAAVICGFLHAPMFYSLGNLEEALRERNHRKPVLLIHNSGGMAALESTHALQTIHSGPTAGLAASQALATQYGYPAVVATDMGGTSFDIGIMEPGSPWIYDFQPTVDRWRVATPMVYLRTIGAGGGSIARYDRLWRTVSVGPDSSGSDPGPACYGRGGTQPTTTDADVVLGYYDPDYYAGGAIPLDKSLAELTIQEEVADPLGISVEEAALLIKRKVDNDMADAIFKEVSTRGFDPRKIVVVAYGGAGPAHCCGFARELGTEKVVVPPFSSVFSALGAANLEQLHIHERSVYMIVYNPLTRQLLLDVAQVNAIFDELEERGAGDLMRQGFDRSLVKHKVEFDMRYGNQLVQLSVTSPVERLSTTDDILNLVDEFSRTYVQRYGERSSCPEAGVKIAALRVLSWVETEPVRLAAGTSGNGKRPSPKKHGERQCHFPGQTGAVATPIYRWEGVPVGSRLDGPAIVEAPHTTFVVEPGWQFELENALGLVVMQKRAG